MSLINVAEQASPNIFGTGSPPRTISPWQHNLNKSASGNPGAVQSVKGRPRGTTNRTLPYESLFGRKVKITERGEAREVSAAEAFLLQLCSQGLKGKPRYTKIALSALEQGKHFTLNAERIKAGAFLIHFYETDSLNHALEPLGMVQRLGEGSSSLRVALKPWLVQAALMRLGDRRLTPDEQRIVLDATHKPHKVFWPDWWQVRPSA